MRGSIPTPGPGTAYYGGNTSCVEVRSGDEIVILDAGTGLRALGTALMAEFKNKPLNLTLLLTHTHWDHIHGIPYCCKIKILQQGLNYNVTLTASQKLEFEMGRMLGFNAA